MEEKRGPIEKGAKGWPINPFGVVALTIFAIIIVLLIVRPLLNPKTPVFPQQSMNSSGGKITSPQAGDLIRDRNLKIELSVDEPSKVEKVQFWVKTYADGNWQMIGQAKEAPFTLNWPIPQEYQNKAVAISTHIYQKDGQIIKDPGGWREGIIILNP